MQLTTTSLSGQVLTDVYLPILSTLMVDSKKGGENTGEKDEKAYIAEVRTRRALPSIHP